MTTDTLTPETFAHLVNLAALELDKQEAEYIFRELNNQLKVIGELAAIPLDAELPITSHGVPFTPEISPALRRDEWQPYPNPQGIIAQAPQSADGYIVVPDIPHTTLE